ncbi:phosphate-starvation-inducible protein PsiE [Bacillus sp. ISL-7]|uniref:phosphate-starvation-inducible protein PsiE n=1 Tax=Bacillus sp. ISL-7 TaxID=2819136 RepID=UPI002554F276|nr:phosphate-starvation-inducible protein PsiE [Bacillus sp. ISL-7]
MEKYQMTIDDKQDLEEFSPVTYIDTWKPHIVEEKTVGTAHWHLISKVLQLLLNISLVLLSIILSFLLIKELIIFSQILQEKGSEDYKLFLANILIFFLYFEFITMIVKYFKEGYHFPIRYFIYIGITALVRIIIVDHDHPVNTLCYSLAILVLVIGYFIIYLTPRERRNSNGADEKH